MVSSCSLFFKEDAVPLHKPKTRRAKGLFPLILPCRMKPELSYVKQYLFWKKKDFLLFNL